MITISYHQQMHVFIIIIIIINISHYNPLWDFAFSAKSLQVLLSLAASFQFWTFSFFRSSVTFSCHHCLGLPTGLVPIGFQSSSFLDGLAWSILWICPSHLILCALMNLTISAPSINLPISMLFRILHTLSILTGPHTFFNKCTYYSSIYFTLSGCCMFRLVAITRELANSRNMKQPDKVKYILV
jgi:hypothetical protein